jgi:DNA helicase II / ATP-dependent DNA helicase PcrA
VAITAHDLNDAQRAAVMHTEGPLLVLAGAGSGKTRVITLRIARLVASGVDPRAILAVTFTNKAAREMKERLSATIGPAKVRGLTVSTFHSLCARLLRRDGHRIGLAEGFAILDESDQRAQLLHVARAHGMQLKEGEPRLILGRIGLWKNLGVRANDDPLQRTPSKEPWMMDAARLWDPYRRHCRALGAVDFDDLLLLARELLESVPDVRVRYHARFRFLHVDEFQDTNPIQIDLIRLLCGPHRNLCVVGDDDQAIYSFRGADIHNILGFESLFPGCTTVTLEENYRSSGNILACANHIIAKNTARKSKRLYTKAGDGVPVDVRQATDGDDEADMVVNDIDDALQKGARHEDIALLFRSAPQSRPFEESLRLRGIPYRVVGGQEFFERRDVKDILAYLACVARARDELSWRRALSVPSRGIGDKSLTAILAAVPPDTSMVLALQQTPVPGLSAKAQQALATFVTPLARMKGALPKLIDSDGDVASPLRRSVLEAGYAQRLQHETDLEKRAMAEDTLDEIVDGFAAFVDRWREASLAPDLDESAVVLSEATADTLLLAYLDRLALQRDDDDRSDDDEEKEARGRVTLMSLHASKGLEYALVYLVGVEEGLLPHRRALEEGNIDEERRLAYVGVTRARVRLVMTHCAQRRRRHEWVPRVRSRFLDDVVGRPEATPAAPAIDGPDAFFAMMKQRNPGVPSD